MSTAPDFHSRNRQSGFSLVIPIALLLAVAVFAFAVYRYRLFRHLPVISDLPVLPDIPVLSAVPDADPAVFPAADGQPGLAPTPDGFGDIRWQMSPSDIRAIEGVPPFRTSPTALVYSLDILTQPCLLTYFFRRGQLYGVQFQFAAPGSDFLPPLTGPQTRKLYARLKSQLDARYGTAVETTTSHPRNETEDCTLRLQDARYRLDERTARLRNELGDAPDAAQRLESELMENRLEIADLEQELHARQAADLANPLVSRQLAQWTSGPVSITLAADFTTTPPGLEIRYKTK